MKTLVLVFSTKKAARFLWYRDATICIFCNPLVRTNHKAMKKSTTLLFPLFLFLTACNGEIEPADLTRSTLTADSELFELIQSVLVRKDRPVENTVCIDFVYPFKIFIYDAAFYPQGSVSLYNDDQFSQFLAELDPDVSISISYPIQTSLPDGTIFSVNSDEQLKLALDSCSREDIIAHCNGLIRNQITCVWKMDYLLNQNNEFAESVFKANGDGSISFHHRNTDYLGTWIFLFINENLYLNINLAGTSDVAQQWNHNYLVTTLNGNFMQINFGSFQRVFKKGCSTTLAYDIGEAGPLGGIVAYDKGEYTNGWRYIEVAQSDMVSEEWGCDQSLIDDAQYDEMGTGYQNTIANLQFHNNLTNYYLNPIICSTTSNGTLSAKTALTYDLVNASDWFIPSINELQIIHDNLLPLNLGNFDHTAYYWSSTEFDTSKAKCLNFVDGEAINISKNDHLVKTRLIRYF